MRQVDADFMREIMDVTDKVPADDFDRVDTHVVALHNDLLKLYGPAWIDWLPETLWQHLERDVRKEPLERVLKDKILALQVSLATNRPWVEWEVFEKVATAFDGDLPNPGVVEVRKPEEVLLALRILNALRPTEEFSLEVLAYVAACFAHEGFLAVGPLPRTVAKNSEKSAQTFLDEINWTHAQVPAAFADRVSESFTQLWQRRTQLSTDKNLEQDLLNAEDDTIRVQLRKLYGAYKYVELNDGLDRPLDI